MRHAGKGGVPIVLFPAETSATFATDKSAAQRGGIHCMLNMLFASLPKQMLDSIIRLAVNNPRMGVGRVIPIPLSPVPQALPWEGVCHICLLVHRIPNIFFILQHFHNGLKGPFPTAQRRVCCTLSGKLFCNIGCTFPCQIIAECGSNISGL